jgi:hypothetical protein
MTMLQIIATQFLGAQNHARYIMTESFNHHVHVCMYIGWMVHKSRDLSVWFMFNRYCGLRSCDIVYQFSGFVFVNLDYV